MNIQPVQNRVLIRVVTPDSDIVLPSGVNHPNPYGLVLAVGPDVKCCAIGDHVLFLPNASVIIMDERGKIAIIHDSAIFAIDREVNNVGN